MYEFTIKISEPRVEILPLDAFIVPPCTCRDELLPVIIRVFVLKVPLNEAALPVKFPINVVVPVARLFFVDSPDIQFNPVKDADAADKAPDR